MFSSGIVAVLPEDREIPLLPPDPLGSRSQIGYDCSQNGKDEAEPVDQDTEQAR